MNQTNLLNNHSLPLGWQSATSPQIPSSIGFLSQIPPSNDKKHINNYHGDAHLLTFGPTGSGKSRSCAIPALLSYSGPCIAVDVKGELFQTTAEYRKSIGQKVLTLDPWGLTNQPSDAINPLDLLQLPDVDIDEESQTLATLLNGGERLLNRDLFWENTSTALNAGIIAYLATSVKEKDRRLSKARELFTGDLAYTFSNLLDNKLLKSQLAEDEFAIFLEHPQRGTRPSVQSTAQQQFRLFGSPQVRNVMDKSTIDIQEFIRGEPITLYIVIPPHKLQSHANLLKLWLGFFLQLFSRRTTAVETPTLMLVDEAGSLGYMESLEQAIILLRSYGVKIWTFWQDIAQIKSLYQNNWQTIVNNSGVVQCLGANNLRMAKDYTDLIGGISAEELLTLPSNQFIQVSQQSKTTETLEKLDYLTQSPFKERSTPNPQHHIKTASKDTKITSKPEHSQPSIS